MLGFLVLIPCGAQRLLLPLYSGIIPCSDWGTIWDAREIRTLILTWVGHVQGQHPSCCTIAPAAELLLLKTFILMVLFPFLGSHPAVIIPGAVQGPYVLPGMVVGGEGGSASSYLVQVLWVHEDAVGCDVGVDIFALVQELQGVQLRGEKPCLWEGGWPQSDGGLSRCILGEPG